MNIQTRYSIGSVVIVRLDGFYQKAVVTALRVYIPDDYPKTLQPIIHYQMIAKWKTLTGDQRRQEWITVDRETGASEEEINDLFRLYEKHRKALKKEELELEPAKRDRLIMVHMRMEEDKPTKEAAATHTKQPT